MASPDRSVSPRQDRWTSLWIVALVSLLAQLWLCQFFSFGERVPASIDVDPSNLWKFAYHFPPTGSFQVLNWLGIPYAAQPLNPFSLMADGPLWFFFTAYVPIISTFALLTMAAFLRELDLPRPAALFGAVIFAWQGDIVSFIYPGHFAYITSWPFFAIAAWGALRAERTGHWAYPVISGAACGTMVGLLTNADRGAIASFLIAALYVARFFRRSAGSSQLQVARDLFLCVAVAALVALAPLLSLIQNNIVGVKMGGTANREQIFKLVTQFSLGPAETLTYLIPGLYGWHINSEEGPYWGWVGETLDWPKTHQGTRDLNLAISTTGTIAAVLALIGILIVLSDRLLGAARLTERQRFYGLIFLIMGVIGLVLSWGWHTPFYRPLFALPLMDKWRDPLKWLEMTNFALIVFSAFGMWHLLESLDTARVECGDIRKRLGIFTNSLLLMMGLGWVAGYPLGVVLAAILQAEGADPSAAVNMMSTMHTALLIAFLLMALLCLLLRGFWRPDFLRSRQLVNPFLARLWQRMLLPENLTLTLSLTLAAVGALQLGWVMTKFIQPAPLEALVATNPLLDRLRSEGNTVRVSVSNDDPILNNLLQNQFAAMGISCFEISAASRIPDDLNTFMRTLDGEQTRIWQLAGVKNVVVPEQGLAQLRQDAVISADIANADGYTLAQTDNPDLPSHAMVGLKDYLAKATLVPAAEFFPDDKALLKRLKDSAWNPRATVLLDHKDQGHAEAPVASVPASSTADEVNLKTYTPTQISIDVTSAKGGYVLINDQYDSDWQAQVNGVDAPLLRADYILRAIPVSAGHSTVMMSYRPQYHLAGLNLSAVALNLFSDAVMLAAWLIAAYALYRSGAGASRF
jgi:Bacterial membrane protein YfhO